MRSEILVADDQLGIRLLLTDVFTNIGYHVSVAETGEEALGKIYDRSFDLILLDYRLPIINGQEIIQQMLNDEIQTPIILMSGLVESIEREQFKESMIRGMLAKPFDIADVCNLVQDVLNQYPS